MRNAFAQEITELAKTDPQLVLLVGDIGNKLFDDFKLNRPERFFNCGVAEGNMIGVAAGLALSGFHPVVYTINSFLTTRCYEQIKIDVCFHNLPVTLVGVGGGLAYASLGVTHQSCEDVAILSVIPNMTVICPGDPVEVRLALRAAVKQTGPVFIRLGKKGEPVIHKSIPEFLIGRPIVVSPGEKICLLSTGATLELAMETAQLFKDRGQVIQVVSVHTVKPLDLDFLQSIFKSFQVVATIEEHSIHGGLGGSVAEWLADHPQQGCRLIRFGAQDWFVKEAGEQEHVRDRYGLTAPKIADVLSANIKGNL